MSRVVRFVGDVHGKYRPYKRLIENVPESIQVGDMGVGFRKLQGPNVGEVYANPPHYAMAKGRHRFIRGNHDNPGECRKHDFYIPDGTIEDGVMFVGGAVSIDRMIRQTDYNWWPDEELSASELNEMVDKYLGVRPRIMVTHDCPQDVAAEVSRMANWGAKLDPRFASRTRQAFQLMWSAHSPEMWIFGHWHFGFDRALRGTRFICLAELEHRDIEI